jgi:hypothetical protein
MRPSYDSIVDPSELSPCSAEHKPDDAEARERCSSSWELDIHERPTLIP